MENEDGRLRFIRAVARKNNTKYRFFIVFLKSMALLLLGVALGVVIYLAYGKFYIAVEHKIQEYILLRFTDPINVCLNAARFIRVVVMLSMYDIQTLTLIVIFRATRIFQWAAEAVAFCNWVSFGFLLRCVITLWHDSSLQMDDELKIKFVLVLFFEMCITVLVAYALTKLKLFIYNLRMLKQNGCYAVYKRVLLRCMLSSLTYVGLAIVINTASCCCLFIR